MTTFERVGSGPDPGDRDGFVPGPHAVDRRAGDPGLLDRVRRRLADAPIGAVASVAGSAPAGTAVAALIASESRLLADDRVLAELSRGVTAELAGAGPLEALLALPGVTDVLVNGPSDVWIDRGAGLQRTAVRFADDAAVRRLAQRLAALAGRRLDDATPFVDASLADGTRLHAALPPLAAATTVSLRVLARRRVGLGGLVPPPVAELLAAIVSARLAFVISGATGSGKTTLLGALLGCVAPTERILLIEDAPELVTSHQHVVRLATRAPNIEGSGAIGLRELVRQALRMRPDRIVLGEFRGAETVDLLIALNTGHEGGAATLHANSAADVPGRLTALGTLGGLAPDATNALVASALDVVIHLRRDRSGQRHVAEVGLLRGVAVPAWSAGSGACAGGPTLRRLLRERDVDVPAVLP